MDKEKIFINRHGVRNKKCCASCTYYDFGKCVLQEIETKNYEICDDWRIRPTLLTEGKSIGKCRTRKKEFIEYLCKRLKDQNLQYPKETARECIEKEWTDRHGSPYINI